MQNERGVVGVPIGRKFYFASYLMFFTTLYLHPSNENGTPSPWIVGFGIHIDVHIAHHVSENLGSVTQRKPKNNLIQPTL